MDDIHWSVSRLIFWSPPLLLFGCVLWHAHHIRKCLTTSDGRSLAQALEDCARETKRASDLRQMAADAR